MVQQRLELTWYNKDKALIPTEAGKYGYSWVDPADPRYCETHTLVMDDYVQGEQAEKSDKFEYSERSDLTPQTDNLMILGESGDVLEALTRVPELAEKYVGKIKLVYIDPPFNTAQTFANYEDNLEHSIWLTMMRDRLFHLKRLLVDDGSIWVHLDEVENHRMRLLLDEVFGANNFVTDIVWETTTAPSNNSGGIPMTTDSILVYSKKSELFTPSRLSRKSSMDLIYKNPDGDPRGRWTTDNPCARHNLGRRQHPGVYGIQHPITGEMVYPPSTSNWRLEQQTILEILQGWATYDYGQITDKEFSMRRKIEGEGVELRDDVKPLVIPGWNQDIADHCKSKYENETWPLFMLTKQGIGGFRYKRYLSDVQGTVPGNLFRWQEVGHSDSGKKEIKALFPEKNPFSTPKPERLVERIIHIGSNPGDIVLDVFGGSGTTAAVAQKMGRRWVTCELLENTFNTFTRPRLEKVVKNEDSGGITRTKGERVAAEDVELPDGVSPDDAAKFVSVLNKLIADNTDDKKSALVKKLKKASKTKRTKDVINWRGGGGFQVAHLSPACFDYDQELDRVMLTDEATGQILIESVAANLGFKLLHPDDDSVFDGRRGNSLLKVYEGVPSHEFVDQLVSHIQPGERIVLASTRVPDGIREYLRKSCKGSRLVAIPDGIFSYSKGGDH